MLSLVERGVERLALGLALSAALGLLLVALATMLDVLLRWLFKLPIPGLGEISALVTAVAVAGCFPMLIANRGNVTIRLLGSALGSPTARVLDSFGALVSALFFCAMTYQYVLYAAEITGAGESTPILRWPAGPWWWAVTVMIGIAALAALVVLGIEMAGAGKRRD